MSNDFEFMDETVDKICESLRKEPHLWEFGSLTLKDTISNIRYWTPASGPITERMESTPIRVFSDEQGQRIREAYNYAINIKATILQQEIIDSYKVIEKVKEVKNKKSFWNWF